MSQSVKDFTKTLTAGEDLSAKIGYIGQLDASGNLEVGESATDLLVGVIVSNDGGSGSPACYQFLGTAKVIAGGSVSIGAFVTSDTAGKAVATTTDKDVVIGRALEAADDGDFFEVQLFLHKISI